MDKRHLQQDRACFEKFAAKAGVLRARLGNVNRSGLHVCIDIPLHTECARLRVETGRAFGTIIFIIIFTIIFAGCARENIGASVLAVWRTDYESRSGSGGN